LTRVNIRIKIVIIFVLKLDSGVDLVHGSRWSTQVGQLTRVKVDKNGYYHNFKT
jgi:hypothetical protein